MPRFLRELALTGTIALVVTVVVAIAGRSLAMPSAWPPGSPARGADRCFDAPAGALSGSSVEGHARLCTDAGGVLASMHLRGLRAGEVYTAWLAYFERPSGCFAVPCAAIDLDGDDPVGVLGRVDGLVMSDAGEAELQGEFRGLRAIGGAQITLLVLGHGAASSESSRARARQLLSPQTPQLGAPLAGALADGGRAWPLAQASFVMP